MGAGARDPDQCSGCSRRAPAAVAQFKSETLVKGGTVWLGALLGTCEEGTTQFENSQFEDVTIKPIYPCSALIVFMI